MAVWSRLQASSAIRHRLISLPRLLFSLAPPPPPPPPPPSSRRYLSCGPESQFHSSVPVEAVVHVLDGFHHFTGLPWWMVITSSTVAVRLALLPLLVVQLKKLKTISELLPHLPLPIPQSPTTLRSSIHQVSLFLKESRAIGCPSFLWFFPYLSVQLPCFFLLMATIRKMSLDAHPGFDSGGALWFQNLSAFSSGSFGTVFPILIAGLHYINIQISFNSSTVRETTGWTGLLMRYYKLYLEILSVPLFFVGYAVPQGSLVYWVTNSSVNIFQQLSLKHPTVAAKLGLLSQGAPPVVQHPMEISESVIKYIDSDGKEQTLSLQTLTPEELLSLSVQVLSKGDTEPSVHLLRLALEKDPGYARGLVLMGQTLLQKAQLSEATEYLELAISKLLDGSASEAEDVELLMLASQWAGAAYIQQGNMKRGITHLERVAKLKEPGDIYSKEHYFEALVLLSSALYKEGKSDEAAKILRIVVEHNPAYKPLLEQCEDENELVSDLVSSRSRKDNF